MTHSLHRKGTAENLSNDFVILAMAAKNINEEGAADRMRQFLSICLRHRPVNIGDMRIGNVLTVQTDELMEKITSTSIVHAVYTDAETVSCVLKDLKAADLGLSVTVSGLFAATRGCCGKVGITPHSIEHSLGIWGNTAKLATPELLEVTTMCGHAMVASQLVLTMAEQVKAGRISAEDASAEMTKQCVCGIFNPLRAKELLLAMAAQ